ncbi:hypothetical protein BJ322DRAFT_507647 [Thelephora terrestris]|uniref:Uncharacterized protein n=1 Tax=Thelephora terrestris TaxID=56493 RepID=A0A9P6L1I9_9AGAM|nr:hypothetical protein BJ322DRAFT_507647 [Thelephora terrestris]
MRRTTGSTQLIWGQLEIMGGLLALFLLVPPHRSGAGYQKRILGTRERARRIWVVRVTRLRPVSRYPIVLADPSHSSTFQNRLSHRFVANPGSTIVSRQCDPVAGVRCPRASCSTPGCWLEFSVVASHCHCRSILGLSSCKDAACRTAVSGRADNHFAVFTLKRHGCHSPVTPRHSIIQLPRFARFPYPYTLIGQLDTHMFRVHAPQVQRFATRSRTRPCHLQNGPELLEQFHGQWQGRWR